MSETPETPAARRRRLRLITFAELIGVFALLISAASYWDSHRERESVEAAAAPARVPLLLTATVDAGGRMLRLKPARGDGVVQTQALSFPDALAIAPTESTGDARLDAGHIDTALRRAVPASTVRPPRLPVGIVTTYEDKGVVRADAAIYDIGYAFHDRLLRGRALELEGLTLVRRLPANALPSALAARWAKVAPAGK